MGGPERCAGRIVSMEPWQVAVMLVLVIVGIVTIIWFLLIMPAFFLAGVEPKPYGLKGRDEWERE